MQAAPWFAILMGLFLAGPVPARAEFNLDDMMAAIADQVIRPSYDALTNETAKLDAAMGALCAAPSGQAHESAKSAFSEALSAWSRAEIVREGPVMQENRLERMLFYPDRKGTGLKQVQAALAAQDETVTEAETLKAKSVAMQGFNALEYLLFGTEAEKLASADGAFRCRYGEAISENLSARAEELATAWAIDGETDRLWNSHDVNNPFFRTDREAMNLVLGTLIHGLEQVRDVRLGSFLDVKGGKDRPKSAIHWRSHNTIRSIADNLAALQDMFEKSGLAGALPEAEKHLANSISFEFRTARQALAKLDGPVDQLLSDDATRKALVFVDVTTGDLVHRLDQDFAIASGLAAGFSFADGD